MLKVRSRGIAVRKIQSDLVKLGYDLVPDGKFGLNTLRAVRAFQSKTGLVTDGIVGRQTQAAIFNALNPVVTCKPTSLVFDYMQFIDEKDEQTKVKGIPNQYWGNIQTLIDRLEMVQQKLGVQLIIRSGFRSKDYNKKVGGSNRSQHIYGKAADIYVKDYRVSCFDLAKRIYDDPQLRSLFGGFGLGSDKNLHVDIRTKPNPIRPTVWWYMKKSWREWSRSDASK